MRLLTHVALLWVVSCSVNEAAQPPAVCGPQTCDGCCTAAQECVSGVGVFECGGQGEACVACAPNELCAAGQCGRFADQDYDAQFPQRPDASVRLDAGVFPFDGGLGRDAGSDDAGPMEVSFSAQVQPIFDSRCDACHQWSYDTIVNVNLRVTPLDPASSAIYTRTLSGDMPRAGGPLTGTQQRLLRDWILNGAPRN